MVASAGLAGRVPSPRAKLDSLEFLEVLVLREQVIDKVFFRQDRARQSAQLSGIFFFPSSLPSVNGRDFGHYRLSGQPHTLSSPVIRSASIRRNSSLFCTLESGA